MSNYSKIHICFNLLLALCLPFLQNASNLKLKSTVVQQVPDKGSRRMEEPIPAAEVAVFLSIGRNTL